MPDVMLQQVVPEAPTLGEIAEFNDTANVIESVEQLGIKIDDKEGVKIALDTLRAEFGINDSVFNNLKSQLALTAIASRLNQLENDNSYSFTQKTSELEYIADLVMVTVGKETMFSDEYKSVVETLGVSDEQTKIAYEQFKQPEVTRDMSEYIHGPAFNELRRRLGIVDEEEFQVCVLSIDDGYVSQDLAPSIDWDNQSYDEAIQEDQENREYLLGLQENGKKLNAMLGRNEAFAPAWVSTLSNGEKILCMSLPTAEKILYRNEKRGDNYTEDDWGEDLAFVEHEYTHTQKMLLFNGDIGLGIALEELRAEHFSGDKHGYMDIKKYFMGMKMITGYSPKDSFEPNNEPYDEERFLADIVKNIGLGGFLDALALIPSHYAKDEHANTYVRGIVSHNGGSISKQFSKLYKKAYDANPKGVRIKLNNSIDKLRETLKPTSLSVESWLHYGGVTSLGTIGTENFRRRYPEESDNYDYRT